MNINNWITYNGSEYTINGKTYRNLEAQVLENMDKVDTFDSRITELDGAVTELGNTVGNHTDEITNIWDNVEDIEGDIVTINNDIDNLETQYGTLDTFRKATVTLVDGDWDASNQQTVSVNDLLATDTVWVTPNTSIDGAMTAYLYTQAGIVCIGGDDGELTFQAVYPDELPPADINVDVVFTHVVADGGGSPTPSTPELMWCVKGTTTFAQITSAIQNQVLPVILDTSTVVGGIILVCSHKQYGLNDSYVFTGIQGDVSYSTSCYDDNTWDNLTAELTLEQQTNKVTTVNQYSTDTNYPSAKAVYTAIENAVNDVPIVVFDATRTMPVVTLSNSKTMQDIVDAYDNGNRTVYIRIKGVADTNQYATYRVVFAYNNMLDTTKCTVYTEAIPLSLGSSVGAEMLYYPALTATGNVFQPRTLTW